MRLDELNELTFAGDAIDSAAIADPMPQQSASRLIGVLLIRPGVGRSLRAAVLLADAVLIQAGAAAPPFGLPTAAGWVRRTKRSQKGVTTESKRSQNGVLVITGGDDGDDYRIRDSVQKP